MPEVGEDTEPRSRDEVDRVVPPRLGEAALVGRAQDGDLESFEVLLARYQVPLFRLALRLLGDRGDAEDAVQDTFVLVWRRLPSLLEPELFHGWVYQIATRRCLNLIRSRERHPAVPVADETLELTQDAAPAAVDASDGADPAATAERAVALAALEAALRQLPEEQRVCWVLREMHELSYPEIAYATRLPVSTVRGRIARARQNLAGGMNAWR